MQMELHWGKSLNREQSVLQNCKARKEIGDLISPGETESSAPVRRQPCQVVTEEVNLSFGRLGFAADQAEEGRLAGAVWANDRSAFARCDGKAHAVHGAKTIKCLRHVRKAQSETGRVSHIEITRER
jgi:hypothetical protein